MSVVHRLSAGWLLDHLSFINKAGYQLCHSSQLPDEAPITSTSSVNPVVPSCFTSISSPVNVPAPELGATVERAVEIPHARYVFRDEFFQVFKPHIVAFPQKKPQQRNLEAGHTGLKDNTNGAEQEGGARSDVADSVASVRKTRKRKHSGLNQGELDALEYHTKIRGLIWEGSTSIVQEGFKSGFLQSISAEQSCSKKVIVEHIGCGLAELCEMAKRFPSVNENAHQIIQMTAEVTIPEQDLLSCVTENMTSYAKILNLMGQKYLVPPKSSFLLSDISCMKPLLDYKKKYDVIVIDPPWANKSVKRSNRYSYLSPWQIKQIPISALAAPNCLVVTWVTNRQKHLRFVKDELYPHWSVKTLAEWHWVKITRSGEFIFPLDSSHKKPYEVLVLGRVQGNVDLSLRKSEVEEPSIPDHKLIVSVPCTLHSHKPPLAGMFLGSPLYDIMFL